MEANPINNIEGSQLKQLLESYHDSGDFDEVIPSELRYAVYVRKSTEGAERQARSIPDQIEDCFESVIKPLGITIQRHDIFKEEKSAKEAGTRPVFRNLINAIESGRYDGVISWHPDRLSRNMKDAGEIIDLIDRNVIKDVKFARANFENSPSGKMMLGISFVLSKHYSEHLSESVNRGNRRITEQGGVLSKFKHGYRVMPGNLLIADGDNYLLIQQAFEMRKNNSTLDEIATFLNNSSYQNYHRTKGHRNYKFDKDAISKMLKDPIYAGVNVYGHKVGLVSDHDPSFTPMLTEAEFLDLHGEKDFMSKLFRAARVDVKTDNSNFLRRCVKCGQCGRYMTTSTATSGSAKKTTYFYYRCENKSGCALAGAGLRGSIVIDYVLKFLEEYRFTTKSNYEHYKNDVEEKIRFETEDNDRVIKSATNLLDRKKREFGNMKSMAADKENPMHIYYGVGELKKLDQEIKEISKELRQAKERKAAQNGSILNYEDFLKLFDNSVELLRSTTHMSTADEIVRIFFSNFTAKAELKGKNGKQKQWSITNHCLNKPYDEFVKNGNYLTWSG